MELSNKEFNEANIMRDRNDNQEIKVSVFCATYNHERYIRRTLDGFVNQKTKFKYEVFVHDDASSDGTKAIILEYAEKYPNIIIPILQNINQYSKGVNILKTYVLPKMRGKYIATCEGDDYWSDEYKLQKQVDFLENHVEYSACVHNSIREDMFKKKISLFNDSLEAYDLNAEHVMLRGGADYHTSSLMYRVEYAMESNSDMRPDFFDKPKNIGDYPLSIFLTIKGKVRYLPDTMSVYRFGTPGSWSSNIRNARNFVETEYSLIDMLKSVDEYTDFHYHITIQSVIEKHYLKILNLETNLNVLKSEEMIQIFQTQKAIRRCIILIKLLFVNKFLYYKE